MRTCTSIFLRLFFIACCFVFVSIAPYGAYAQEDAAHDVSRLNDVYVLGEVVSVVEEGIDALVGIEEGYQRLLVAVPRPGEEDRVVTLDYRSGVANFSSVKFSPGDRVVLTVTPVSSEDVAYTIVDHYRLPTVIFYLGFFVLLALVLGKRRGFFSLLALLLSLLVLVYGVAPAILAGYSPVLVSILAVFALACTSFFVAHGFSKRTLLALSATLAVIVCAFLLAYGAVIFGVLTGATTEEAIYLQVSYLASLNLQGLLLGAFVLGALGVLDDVTTTQIATVGEIYHANPTLSFSDLFMRGLRVGRSHIASLVNTLALAYVGVSFPLFLLFSIPGGPPLWVLLNSEGLAEEMLRALLGGSVLMLAVPVATFFGAWAFVKRYAS